MQPGPDDALQAWLHEQHFLACGAAELAAAAPPGPLKDRLEAFRARRLPAGAGEPGGPAPTHRHVVKRYLHVLSESDPGSVFYPTPVTASAGGAAPVVGVFFSRERGGRPSYVWCVGSYESRDGEYRPLFYRTEDFLEKLRVAPAREAAVLAGLEAGLVELVVGGGGPVAAWADESRAALKVLVAALNEPVFPPNYSAAVAAFRAEVRARAPGLIGPNGYSRGHFLGAKLVPLYRREVLRHEDLRLGAWRELAAARAAADLVLNSVCPGFPFGGGDHLVADSRASLYNNEAMKARFARSLAAGRVTRRVLAARAALREEGALAGSERGAKLDSLLLGALEYAQSFALLSGVASLHASESVGRALGDFPPAGLDLLVRQGCLPGEAPPRPPPPPPLAAERGAGFVFRLAFSLHCLHSRARVAHGDLHINNLATINLGLIPDALAPPEPAVFYAAGPSPADVYCFPAPPSLPSIIDFSRALLGPGFPGADETPGFFADQAPRALRALHALSPEFVAGQAPPLLALFELKPAAGFALLCAADFFALGRALGPALAPTPAAAAAAALEAAAGRAFGAALAAAAAAAAASDFSALPAEPPGAALLREVFGAFAAPAWLRAAPAAFFVDGYSALNPLRFTVGGPGGRGCRRPPWADPAEIARRLGGLPPAEAFREYTRPPPPADPPSRSPAWGALVAAEAEAQAEEARAEEAEARAEEAEARAEEAKARASAAGAGAPPN